MAKPNMKHDETVVRLNSKKSISVETTIPDWIASQMGLKKSDIIKWEYDQARRRATFFKTGRKSKP